MNPSLLPERMKIFPYRIFGLGLNDKEYVKELIKFFLAEEPNGKIGIYAQEIEAESLFFKLKNALGERMDHLLLPDAIHRQLNNTKHRSTRAEVFGVSLMIFHSETALISKSITDAKKLFRDFIVKSFAFSEKTTVPDNLIFIFPFLPKREINIEEFGNPFPTLYISTSKAASGRMGPTLRALAARDSRTYRSMDIMDSMRMRSLRSDSRIARNDFGPTWNNLRDTDESRYYVRIGEAASWYDFIEVHKVPKLSDIGQVPYLDTILLMRDPRDMLASHLIYMNQKAGLSFNNKQKEKYLLDLIDYEIKYLVAEFVEAISLKNIYCLRFEDVHSNPRQTYKHLLKWLDWRMVITDSQLEHDIALGSFKVQSKGEVKRGEKNFFETSPNGFFIRKGTPGDWHNHFTDNSKKLFKEKCGEALIILGYEKSLNW